MKEPYFVSVDYETRRVSVEISRDLTEDEANELGLTLRAKAEYLRYTRTFAQSGAIREIAAKGHRDFQIIDGGLLDESETGE